MSNFEKILSVLTEDDTKQEKYMERAAAQRLYDKISTEYEKKGKSEKEAHELAQKEMRKKYPTYTASSNEGEVYEDPSRVKEKA